MAGGSLKGEPKFRADYATACCFDQSFEFKLKLLLIGASEATLYVITLALPSHPWC